MDKKAIKNSKKLTEEQLAVVSGGTGLRSAKIAKISEARNLNNKK